MEVVEKRNWGLRFPLLALLGLLRGLLAVESCSNTVSCCWNGVNKSGRVGGEKDEGDDDDDEEEDDGSDWF